MTRLETISAGLAARVRAANAARRRAAVRALCVEAAAELGGGSPDIVAAMGGIGVPDEGLRARLEALRAAMDERYFMAEQQGEKISALRCFSEARLAAALIGAMSAEDEVATCDAIYEGLMALPARDAAIQRLAAMLACSAAG